MTCLNGSSCYSPGKRTPVPVLFMLREDTHLCRLSSHMETHKTFMLLAGMLLPSSIIPCVCVDEGMWGICKIY